MKMSLSHVLMKAWRVPVFWVLAFSVLGSLFKGTTSQCFTGNRPLILSTVSDSPNRLSTDHLSLPARNINCQWKITARVGDLIALTVMNIDLISSYNCSSQSITIYDGETENNRNLGNFCGRQRGQILYSSTRYMLIKFISIGSLATGGFNLSYAKPPVDSACRTGTRPTRLTGSTSYFTELRFPSSGIYYPNNALCDWLISVPNGYVVQIRVNLINMEQSSNCTYDRMDIYDGSTLYSPLLARICRNYSQIVNGTTTYMFIHFTSDSSITRTGFIVNYKAVLKSSVPTTDSACMIGTRPTRLTGSTSFFTELRFPSSGYSYPNNALCDWLISVSSGYIVQLRINSVNMETFSGCRDRMDIYDGSTDAHLLARICTYYTQTVNSSGTNMLIRFTSGSSFTGSGFSVSYKAVLKIDSACWTGTRPTRLTGSSSYFTELRFPSSGSYPNNALCDWLISVSSGYIVQLRVNSVNMETFSGCGDRLDIYDGSTDAHLLARICTYYTQTVNSSGTNMLIRFTSDSSFTGSGFSASYKAVLKIDSACGLGTRPMRLTGNIYYFTDLRFPSSGTTYTNNALCDWLISVPNGYVVQLRVNSVNMETVRGCTNDHVDIYDGSTEYSPSLARICSYNYTLLNVYSTGTNMLIRFTSDFSITGSGFSVSYKAVRVSSVTTTTVVAHHGDYTSQSSPSTAAIIGGVVGACLVLIVLCVIVYKCRNKSSRDNVSSRNRRTQAPASQDRQDVFIVPTSSTTTTPTAPYFTNYAYSTSGDELPSRNQLYFGEHRNQSTNFTGIAPPDYSDAPPPYSEVVNGCYMHDS